MALPVTFKSVGAATHDAVIASLHRLLGDSPATGKALGSVARGMSARRTFG
jgi:hypothetical protein